MWNCDGSGHGYHLICGEGPVSFLQASQCFNVRVNVNFLMNYSYNIKDTSASCSATERLILTSFQVFNPDKYGGACDWENEVDCGERPICDECDKECRFNLM